jgi:hypothetical protein
MGQEQQPTCPVCAAPLTLALPPGGKGEHTLRCLNCERPDPLMDPQTAGWLDGELGKAAE